MVSETIKGGSENIARKSTSTTCKFFNNVTQTSFTLRSTLWLQLIYVRLR